MSPGNYDLVTDQIIHIPCCELFQVGTISLFYYLAEVGLVKSHEVNAEKK